MGQKYASYNAAGAIVAYYDSEDSPPPDGATVLEITDAEWLACISTQGYTIVDGALVAPAAKTDAELLAEAQTARSATLRAACSAAIAAGFTSSALGADHSYPSDAQSQANIALAAVSGGSIWCEDSTAWAMTAHNAAQAEQVRVDLFAMIQAAQVKYAALLADIAAATTVAAVEAIVWA